MAGFLQQGNEWASRVVKADVTGQDAILAAMRTNEFERRLLLGDDIKTARRHAEALSSLVQSLVRLRSQPNA